MEQFQTEEQQVDAIKKFWKENGSAIIAGLVIGLGGFIGFNYYKDSKLQDELKTSEAYLSIVEQVDQKSEQAMANGEAFIKDNGDSSYVALSAFALAKQAADAQDWKGAAKYLTTAAQKAPNDGIKAIATIRLARVLMQLEQYEEVLKTLSVALPESFKAEVEEVKGDALLKQGKSELARNAYQTAVDASSPAVNPALQMKLDDLAQAVVLN